MKRLLAAAALLAAPAGAEVTQASPQGFVVEGTARVAAPPAQVWAVLVAPQRWWSAGHSWSGDAANFSLDPRAGGCFCEALPGGSVEHMRVIYAKPGEMLRMSGALGPLQGEALTGTLSVELAASDGGTALHWTYVVGGYARLPLEQVAAAVDQVVGEQIARLAAASAPKAAE